MWTAIVSAAAAAPWTEVALTEPTTPLTVGWHDVDGDGDSDHVVAAGNRLVVYDGLPTGFAAPRTLVRTGRSPYSEVGYVDLTGDGTPDVFHETRVYVAAAAGGFTYGSTLDERYLGIVFTDRTDDGLPDLVGLRWGFGDDIALAPNLGGGTFDAASSLRSVDNATGNLTEVDLDGDGRLDLVETRISQGVTWFRDARGTYQAGVVVLPGVWDAFTTDWDGDGDVDLVYGASGQVSVAHNRGNGTFDPAVDVLSSSLFLEAVGELDGDGRPDAVFTSASGVSITLQRANGTLGAPIDLGSGRGRATDVVVQDVDADGDGELFVTDDEGHALADEAAGGWTFTALSGPSTGVNYAVVEVDQPSGPPDLLSAPSGTLARNDGAGGFTFGDNVGLRLDRRGITGAITAVDVDGDGLRDVVVGSQTAGDAGLVWLPNEAGSLGSREDLGTAPHEVRALIPADADADGDEDLLVELYWTTNQGYDGHISVSWLILPERTTVSGFVEDVFFLPDLVVGDFDGDGAADVISSMIASAEVWRNDGSGTLTRQPDLASGATAAGDVDGDGLLDHVSNQFTSVAWARASGPFAWDPPAAISPGDHYYVGASDVDSDGDADVFTTDPDRNVVWWENRAGTFVGEPSLGTLWDRVAFVDLDANGTPDPYGADGVDGMWWPNPLPPPEPTEPGDTGLPPEDTGTPPEPTDTDPPTTPTDSDGGATKPDAEADGGCGCTSTGVAPSALPALLLAGIAAARRRRSAGRGAQATRPVGWGDRAATRR